ncbi:MAG: phosphoribosylanthranilate isomerase [Ardenticatenaceae bacterium]
MRVKICGNTNLEDARVAAGAGADMLGFIFYPPSPRSISVEGAAEIISALRDGIGASAPAIVGVFVDESPELVRECTRELALDLVQLHGSEPPVEVRLLQPYAFKAIRPRSRGGAEALAATYADVLGQDSDVPHFLVDAHHPWKPGGSGQTADWAIGQVLARRFRILLAGGLTPDNVRAAIQRVNPWGVDVASGVEREPGIKDHERVRQFIRAAHEYQKA